MTNKIAYEGHYAKLTEKDVFDWTPDVGILMERRARLTSYASLLEELIREALRHDIENAKHDETQMRIVSRPFSFEFKKRLHEALPYDKREGALRRENADHGYPVQRTSWKPEEVPIGGCPIKFPQYCRCEGNYTTHRKHQDCGCAFGQCEKGNIL